jgi:hypothetical protein
MQMKKLLTVIAISTAIYLLYRGTIEESAPIDRRQLSQLASTATVPEAAPDARSAAAHRDCEIIDVPSIFAPRQGIYLAAEAEILTAIDGSGYHALLKNPTAAKQLAALTIAMKCSPSGGNADLSFISIETLLRITPKVCASVDASDRSEPLALFQQDQALASPEMMLIASKSALLLARYLEFTGGEKEQIKAHLIMAEQWGHDAAVAGLAPALTFMAEQYDAGSFGAGQLVKAYTYIKKINDASPDSAGKSGVEYIYQKMTRSELNQAENQVKTCRSPSYQSSPLKSPFDRT